MSFLTAQRSGNAGRFVGAFDADVVTWAAQVETNGGAAPSGGFKAQLSAFIAALKASTLYTLIDDMWPLVPEDATAALTSFKQLRLATAVGNPTFTPLRGYAFNGTTQYIDTGFIPNTHKVAMTGTNQHIAVYERTNVGATNVAAAGCVLNSTVNMLMNPRTASNFMSAQLSNSVSGSGDAVTDSRGLSVGSRNGALVTDILAYKNGLAVLPVPVAAVGSTLPTVKLFIGARSDASNVATGFRAATLGFVSVGAAIAAGSQPAFYTAVQDFMTSVGANV